MEKTASVTGASRGIGAAAALALAAQGCRVAVCCRTRRDSAESVARSYPRCGRHRRQYSVQMSLTKRRCARCLRR